MVVFVCVSVYLCVCVSVFQRVCVSVSECERETLFINIPKLATIRVNQADDPDPRFPNPHPPPCSPLPLSPLRIHLQPK